MNIGAPIAEIQTENRQPIRAIIIDDEIGCISNLVLHLAEYCPEIEVTGTGQTVSEARELIQKQKFDVAFMDVQLGHETIFDLFADSAPPFPVVLVTAYDHYAVPAFRIEAVDYLLKPLSAGDLVRCCVKISKAVHRQEGASITAAPEPRTVAPMQDRKLLLRSGDQVFVQRLSDIVYVEANKLYTNIVFWSQGTRKKILVSKPLGQVLKEYDYPDLVRVHKSFAINLLHLSSVKQANVVTIEMDTGDVVVVAKRRTQEFLDCLTSESSCAKSS